MLAQTRETQSPPETWSIDVTEAKILSPEALAALGFVQGHVRLSLTALKPDVDHIVADYEKCDFSFRRANGDVVSSSGLSFGQKRFLALHYLASADPRGPIFVDELANGLHYRLLDETLNMLEGRQTFLASQNPLLLDTLEIDSPQELAQMFIVATQEEPRPNEPIQYTLRQLTDEEAAAIFEAKEAGFRTLSAILRARNLW